MGQRKYQKETPGDDGRAYEAVIIMGSESDRAHAEKISAPLKEWGISSTIYAASAHKEPLKVLDILRSYDPEDSAPRTDQHAVVFITIAGRSNALSGFTAANTRFPVLACPPFFDKVDMMVNINSTLQMPSRTPVLTVIDPGNAALAARRILELAGWKPAAGTQSGASAGSKREKA